MKFDFYAFKVVQLFQPLCYMIAVLVLKEAKFNSLQKVVKTFFDSQNSFWTKWTNI